MHVKEDELDADDKFPRGIKLLSSGPHLRDLSVTKFREDSEYNKKFHSVWTKYIRTLAGKFSEDQIETIKSDWEKRINFLIENKESDFEPFNVDVLRKQSNDANSPATIETGQV